ncbi:hypothetical protein C6502_08770 [Candidatus Poribacteria bacterium]|nr:MAG: hypothetical protein C6502_08770 [Candidatus Poribacteria bacterium]
MHIQDLILLVIGSEENGIRGRTLLQKKLYFLSELEGGDLGFRPHYYGPYSSLVAENLDILVNARFLNEVTETFETDQNIFGEIRRHTYSLTPDGNIVMKEIKKETEYVDWTQALDRLNAQESVNDFNMLSIAAKVCYIVKQEKRTTTEQILQIAQEYGWNLNKAQIESVRSFLEDLSLISVGKST